MPIIRWKVEVANGPEIYVQGNILDYKYKIEAGRGKVAEVSKRWFLIRDTYGVEIEPGQDNALILAIAAALDQIYVTDKIRTQISPWLQILILSFLALHIVETQIFWQL